MRRLASFLAHFALLAAVTGCSLAVEHGLEEAAANEVVTTLERAGIGADKQLEEGSSPPTFQVKVAQADTARALELLRAHGLPRGTRSGFGTLYGKPSLIPTPTEERARFVEALSGELARTLEAIDGVVQARVHLVLEERDPLAVDAKPRVPAQAAVLLKVRPGVAPVREAEVQKLVSGSVAGLAPAAVAVVVTPAPEPGAPSPVVALGPLRVSAGTRVALLAGVGIALVLVAAMALLLLRTARRLAALEQEARQRAA